MAAACVLLASVTAARAEVDHAAIARAALQDVIRPGFTALAERTDVLSGKIEALCREPSAKSIEDAKAVFVSAVPAWSHVEILRFGPIIADRRYERLFYWPDPKGLGTRQIKDVLAKKDPAVTEPAKLAEKSVALQGLPALEYLLYGDGSETLAQSGGDGEFRCRFAAAVAANIATIAKDVTEGWSDGAPAAKAFLEPGPDNPVYRTPKEVTLELFKAFTAGIELMRDQKLAKPLGASPEQAKPRLAAFWRSGLAFASMAGNLEGVCALFAKGGLARIVAQDSPGVENSVLFDLDRAISVLRGIGLPAEEAFRNADLRAKLEALRVSLKSARDTAGDSISRGAGLSFGFNAMDGD